MGLIKMNGVNYWGSAYGQGIIAPMIYSTEEKEVGVYSDGKPLYQKAIELTNLNVIYTEADTYTNVNVSALSIDTMVDMCGWIERSWGTGSRIYNWGYYEKTSTYTIHSNIRWNKTGNAIQYTNTVPSGNTVPTALILIQYTKSTDTAGSGIYTPSGALAVHYSTNEQVIGTWIDGKSLYEKVFTISEVTVSANSWYEITSIDTSNISQLVSNKCLLTRNGMEWGLLSTQKSGNNKLNVLNSRNANIAFDTIVLQYTKTTDV